VNWLTASQFVRKSSSISCTDTLPARCWSACLLPLSLLPRLLRTLMSCMQLTSSDEWNDRVCWIVHAVCKVDVVCTNQLACLLCCTCTGWSMKSGALFILVLYAVYATHSHFTQRTTRLPLFLENLETQISRREFTDCRGESREESKNSGPRVGKSHAIFFVWKNLYFSSDY